MSNQLPRPFKIQGWDSGDGFTVYGKNPNDYVDVGFQPTQGHNCIVISRGGDLDVEPYTAEGLADAINDLIAYGE